MICSAARLVFRTARVVGMYMVGGYCLRLSVACIEDRKWTYGCVCWEVIEEVPEHSGESFHDLVLVEVRVNEYRMIRYTG